MSPELAKQRQEATQFKSDTGKAAIEKRWQKEQEKEIVNRNLALLSHVLPNHPY
jgi:hypothetical protein